MCDTGLLKTLPSTFHWPYCSSTDMFKVFYPQQRKFIPWHPQSVDVLVQSSNSSNSASFSDHEYPTASAEKILHHIVVAKQVTMAPESHSPVMVTRAYSDLIIKPITFHASRASLQKAGGIIKGTLDHPLPQTCQRNRCSYQIT